jgi:hypothetical protein
VGHERPAVRFVPELTDRVVGGTVERIVPYEELDA